MASTSASTTRDEAKEELTNASQEHKPCPSRSRKPSPQRLCSSIFDCLALIPSLFVFSPRNSLSATAISNGHPTNDIEQVAPSKILVEKPPYDVFINHRGIDARETLANPLYEILSGMGFRVFLDSLELELGVFFPTALEEAMSSAKLHIAIFSKNYAQSPWCLEELSFMLRTGRKIVPVFYHVQPEDVRHAKGVFADAFSRHENNGRYTAEEVQEWKNALKIVSCNVGQTIDNKE
jgi:hypothetical protein